MLTDPECTFLRQAYIDVIRLSAAPYHKWDEAMEVVARHHGTRWQGATATLAAKKAKLRQEDAQFVLLLLNASDVFCSVFAWLNDLPTRRSSTLDDAQAEQADDATGKDGAENAVPHLDKIDATAALGDALAFLIDDEASRDFETLQTYNAIRSFIVVRYASLRPLIMNNFEIQAEEIAAWLRATPLIPALGPELWSGNRGHYLAIRLAGNDHYVTEEYEIQPPFRGSSVAKFDARRSIYNDMCTESVRTDAAIERHISGYIFGNNSKTFYYFGRVVNTQDMRFAILRPILNHSIDFLGIRIGGADDSSPRLTFFFALQLPAKLERHNREIGYIKKPDLEKILSDNGFDEPEIILEKIHQTLIKSRNSSLALP